jgi:hypothetical protein
LTLAYLKKGKGKLYAGDNSLAGDPVTVETLTYAAPDGRESKTMVWPSEAELADLFAGRMDMAWKASRSATGGLKAEWDGEGGVEKKPQYGENARRALAGESLIARRPGQDAPIAERVTDVGVANPMPTAKRVATPLPKPGQKLVRTREYQPGMEPPAANRPKDSLDRDIASLNAKAKGQGVRPPEKPLPIAKRAPQQAAPTQPRQPTGEPLMAKRAKPMMAKRVEPKPPPVQKKPEYDFPPPMPPVPPQSKTAPTPPSPSKPNQKQTYPEVDLRPQSSPKPSADRPKPPANQNEIVRKAFSKARMNELNDPMGRDSTIDFDAIPADVGEKFDAHGLQGEASLTSLLNDGIDPNRSFYSDTVAGGRSDRRSNTGMDLRGSSPFVVIGKPGVSLRKGGIAAVIVNGHHTPQIPDLEKAFPGVKFIPGNRAATELAKMGKGAKRVQYDAGDTHPQS